MSWETARKVRIIIGLSLAGVSGLLFGIGQHGLSGFVFLAALMVLSLTED